MLSSIANYLGVLAFPWKSDWVAWTFASAFVGAVYLMTVLFIRSTKLVLLLIIALLNFLPVTAIRLIPFDARYLYFSLIVSAFVLATGFDLGSRFLRRQPAYGVMASAALILLFWGSSLEVAQAAQWYDGFVRPKRVPFRDISQRHPIFPNDTLLYFLDPPHTTMQELRGMFALRYGSQVSIAPMGKAQIAGLREHNLAYAYYFDDTGRSYEVTVDKEAKSTSSPMLPVTFQVSIRLEGYEIASNIAERGNGLVMILYWRALGQIERDYTVFVHLVDARGEIVAGFDGAPWYGQERTSLWKPNQFQADPRVILIPEDAPVGSNYRLEIGLYYLPTMERVGVVDVDGQMITDRIVIAPFEIVE
jgi:hypothetical protein